MFDLTSQNALITGSSRGIGRAMARALAAQGADIAVHYGQNESAAQEVADEVRALGRRAVVIGADVRDGEALKILWSSALSELGRIDILINNAGMIKTSFLAMTSDASWDEVMDVNLKAAFRLSKLAAKAMNRQKSGRIINISSRAGQMGDALRAPYSAAKAGLIGLTKTTARELALCGVTCNAIAPGFIETDMTSGEGTSSDEAKREAQRKSVPVGRFGTADEVAALAVYLCSREAAYVTGQVFAIDGGLRM